MFALPPPSRRTEQTILQARIGELCRCGYIEHTRDGRWLLTEKGWRTLAGAAEDASRPSKQTKLQIENELLESRLTCHMTEKLLRR